MSVNWKANAVVPFHRYFYPGVKNSGSDLQKIHKSVKATVCNM